MKTKKLLMILLILSMLTGLFGTITASAIDMNDDISSDYPVGTQYDSLSLLSETSGDGMIYFTPNVQWRNETSRFAVLINMGGGKSETEELILIENDVYSFAEREGAITYNFRALHPDATTTNQILYAAQGTSKPSSSAMNHYILTDGATNQATGRWTNREVTGGEEPTVPPSVEIVPGPYDQVYWGYLENDPMGSATFSDALSMVHGSTCYITLFSHISLSETIVISEGTYVINLAGHTIESNAQIPFILNNNASLSIKDTGEGGSITARTESDGFIFDIQNATLVIDGGTYESYGNGIISQSGSTSKTTINGGTLYAGTVSAISIYEGKLFVYGGSFYNGCSEAHISYKASSYNDNIKIINLDTNNTTTLVINDIQSSIPATGIGSADRVAVLASPNGEICTRLEPGVVYYIDIKLIIYFYEGHPTESVRKGYSYTIPQYEGDFPFGKEFECWQDTSTKEFYHVGMEFFPTKDMNLFPVWKDGVIISVSFNANGGTGSMGTMDATANAPFSLPACEFTAPEGKVFDKWQINGTTYNVNETVVLNEETEVLALWKDGIRVTYKSNGGSGDDVVIYVESGTKLTLSGNTFTAPKGKSFKRWQVNGAEYSPGAIIPIAAETEILALWKEGFSVKYKPNGGKGTIKEEIYTEETTIILPENFYTAPTDKLFKCWEINGEAFMPGETYTVSEETTILAVWGDLCTVKYLFVVRPLSGEASYTKSRTDTPNDAGRYTVKHPAELFQENFTSEQLVPYYWEDENGRQYQFNETITLTEDISLTLSYKWRLKVYTDPDNNMDSQQIYDVLEGDKFMLPDAPANGNIGYIFAGWKNRKTEAKHKAGDEIVITQNESFIAQWEKCSEHSFKDGICEHCDSPEKCMITEYSAETKTVYIVAPVAGTYTVIFADYEGKELVNMEYTTVTFTEETKGTARAASITKGFSLSAGDKIMLRQNAAKLVPLCKAYTLK